MNAGLSYGFGTFLLATCFSAIACVGDVPADAHASTLPTSAGATSSSSSGSSGTLASGDAGAGAAVVVDQAAACAKTFGSGLKVEYGRLDGVITAIVKPTDVQCTQPIADALVLEVKMSGDVYRMILDTKYANAPAGFDSRMRFYELDTAFAPHGNWYEGWHQGLNLDYGSTIGLRSGMFSPIEQADLVKKLTSGIHIGDRISIYAYGQSSASANGIRRLGGGQDGAIMLHADTGTPHIYAFHFDGVMF